MRQFQECFEANVPVWSSIKKRVTEDYCLLHDTTSAS
jgi:hypothetical protein